MARVDSSSADDAMSACSLENEGSRFKSSAASSITDAALRTARIATDNVASFSTRGSAAVLRSIDASA